MIEQQQLITPTAASREEESEDIRLQTVTDVTPHKVLPLKLSPIISVPELLYLDTYKMY